MGGRCKYTETSSKDKERRRGARVCNSRSLPTDRLSASARWFALLALIRGPLEIGDAGQGQRQSENSEQQGVPRGKITDQQDSRTTERSQKVQRYHGSAMTKAEICQPVGGMVFAGCRKRQQPSPSTRDGYQRGIKNGRTQDQDGSQPTGKMGCIFQTQLQTQGGHQESQEHRAAITHENPGRLEIPAQKSGSGPENSRRQDGDQNLSVHIRQQGKKDRGHRRHAGAQSVHVIEDAK